MIVSPTDRVLVAEAAHSLDERPVEVARARLAAAVETYVSVCAEHDAALARVRAAAVRLGPRACSGVSVVDGTLYVHGRSHVATHPRQAIAEMTAAAFVRHRTQEDVREKR